jgi:hypothetical protein
MRRLQLFELHDCSWCPKAIRNGLTDFLEIATEILDTYGPVRRRVREALSRSGSSEVVDLCSGAGGPWVHWLRKGLLPARVTLTDRLPNLEARQRLIETGIRGLDYRAEPLDATRVPAELKGLRTIFTAFHHFPPEQARAVIEDAVSKRQPIGIFELTSRTPKALLSMLLSPIGVWLLTPRMEKVGWSKWVFSYIFPVIPLVVLIDGIISCFRTYSVEELQGMASASNYTWFIGSVEAGGGPITYLIGHPK